MRVEQMNQTFEESAGSDNYREYMTESHRRFHDRIVADLNGILPICNQGKCTAADISTNLTEQQQITDLMQKVEHLCVHLSESVTDLFAQYYRERGRFCGAAYCTTALIKINLVDRTLQDRATDIRWWAKEPVLVSGVMELEKISRQLQKDFAELSAYMEASVATFRIPTLATGWTSVDLSQSVQAIEKYFPRKRELMFNMKVREQFAQELDALADFLKKGEGQEATVKYIAKLLKRLTLCEEHVRACCEQLETIAETYPTLNDVVVTDGEGFVIANARPEHRSRVLGTCQSGKAWFDKAFRSASSQSLLDHHGDGKNDNPLVVFAGSIRNPEERASNSLGVLGAYCDFQAEVQSLLEDYMPRDSENRVRDGWYSFFTDERGVVVCSSDPDMVSPGTACDLPRNHRGIAAGASYWSHAVFKGRESLVFSARSDGYQGIAGSGWISHLVAPAAEILQPEKKDSRLQISQRHLMRSKLVPEINKSTYISLQDDRQAIKLISLNGILFASQLGKRGAALAPVFDKITATGDSATSRMESMLHEMASSEIELNLHSLETLSKQAVDLMSQKVQERSHALRLWARTGLFRAALSDPSSENTESAARLLKMINDDYPLYQNIILLNSGGEIISCSRPSRLQEAEPRCAADAAWFRSALRGGVQDAVQIHELRHHDFGTGNRPGLMFARPVYDCGNSEQPLGVLACVFGWHTESSGILQSCLPQSSTGRAIASASAFFTNTEGEVLDSTNPTIIPVGKNFGLPEEHLLLQPGKTVAGIFTHQDGSYILASSKMGARCGVGRICWTAHVMRPLV